MEAPVEWMWKDWEKCTGFLDAPQGRLWDSKRFPFAVRERKGNMPPYCWVGDDDRGVCFSCASDQGMHNDDALPAATLDREGRAVVFRAWFVNKPLKLDKPRTFEFALQASPFKPLASGTPPMALRRFPKRMLLRGAWPLFPYRLGHRLLLADLRAFPRSGQERRGDPPRARERIRLYRRLGLVLLGMRRHARVQAVLAGVGQRLGLGQDAAGPLAGVDGQTHARTPACPTIASCRWKAPPNSSPIECRLPRLVVPTGRPALPDEHDLSGQPALWLFRSAGRRLRLYAATTACGNRPAATWNCAAVHAAGLAHRRRHSGTDNPAPGVYPNVCGSAQPGRSFCFRGLIGEYLESDRLPLGTLRVWCSQQWGMNLDWLMQEPNAGATLKYWRALCSRLFLLDVTSFSRWDSADQAACWLRALDLFWLDDPTLVWHPYFRNPIVKSTLRPTTLVSAYTAAAAACC